MALADPLANFHCPISTPRAVSSLLGAQGSGMTEYSNEHCLNIYQAQGEVVCVCGGAVIRKQPTGTKRCSEIIV